MRIERRYTKPGQSAYADDRLPARPPARSATPTARSSSGSRTSGARGLEPGRGGRPRPEIFPQGRRACAPEEGRGERRPVLAVALGPDEKALADAARGRALRSARSSRKQVFDRLAGTWTYWGWKGGYFDIRGGRPRLLRRAPLHARHARWSRRIRRNGSTPACTGPMASTAPRQGHYYVDYKTGKLTKSKSSYEHPQPHACFIQGVADDLVNEGGIMDLWVREARLFKYGSGTGSNFSGLRGEGERLSGGGRSSGLMSFLKIGDRAAGAIKSGGTTRRAAKMVVVDADHPDIENYIDWKVQRGAEGRRARHRLQDLPEAPQGRDEGLRQLRGPGRRLLRSREEPGAEARDQAARRVSGARQHHQARHPVRQAGLHGHPVRRPTTPTGIRRPTSPSPARTPTIPSRVTDDFLQRRRDGRRLGAHPPHGRQGREDAEGARPVGEDRLRRLGLGRSRHAVQHHDQRLAHLPGGRARSAPPIRARNTCSSTTRRATSPR